jgi:hypothetical protein
MEESDEDLFQQANNLNKYYISFGNSQNSFQSSDKFESNASIDDSSNYDSEMSYDLTSDLDSSEGKFYIFKAKNHDIKYNALIFSDNPEYINAFKIVSCKTTVYNNTLKKLEVVLSIKVLKETSGKEKLISLVRDIKTLKPKSFGTLLAEHSIEEITSESPDYVCLFAEIQPEEINIVEMLFDVY